MKKYLIFTMLLLTVLACKPKQRPTISGSITDGGGGYVEPPTIASEDEIATKEILTSITPASYDNDVKGWQNSPWLKEPLLTGGDLGKITNGGFFVANYAADAWIVFSINHERNVYVGFGEGFGTTGLKAALDMMIQKDGKLVKESWDPRKLVYNYEGDSGAIRIAWLGRARYDSTGPADKRFKGYDNIFPNAIKNLKGNNKTYATLRSYSSTPPSYYMPKSLYNKERVIAGFNYNSNPIEDEPDSQNRRKIWASDMYGNSDPHQSPKYHEGYTAVTTRIALRFGYAPAEGGYLSGIGTPGSTATPTNATLEDKENNGQYFKGYDTRNPLGKTMFYRSPSKEEGNEGNTVQFFTTVVAYNIRMRDSTDQKAKSLFKGEYDVKELIFEFDASSFQDTLSDGFDNSDLPKRPGANSTDEITLNSAIKTDKIPVLYFSPKK